MNRVLRLFLYSILGGAIIVIDRILKWYALSACVEPCHINQFLTLECIFNRGISWGLLSSERDIIHIGISLLMVVIIVALLIHSYRRWQQGMSILGEVLVIAGALGNLTDRIIYRGVVDFIRLSYHDWVWPNFNIADMSICIGVGLMLIVFYRES